MSRQLVEHGAGRTLRVPDYPGKPPDPIDKIETLVDHRDAGCVLTSFCSDDYEHSHKIDYDEVIGRLGNVAVDYEFKLAMRCPICGAAGGGLSIQLPKAF
ncbi:hypothetical protein ASG47_07260 [Devosia sp. Leaf420]|nr:hypothetical protein ASG47_07260 [Devosia sp. Leaf420]